MTERTHERHKTEVIGWIERLIPQDEELNPVPVYASTGMLVARVTERLAQAAFALTTYNENEGEGEPSLMQIGVYFIGAAAFALNGIPHIHPDARDFDPVAVKQKLLVRLDRQVDEFLSADNIFNYEEDPDLWLRGTLSLLTGACQSVCELESLSPEDDAWLMSFDDEEEEDEDGDWTLEELTDGWDDQGRLDLERDDEKVDELRVAIAESLFQASVVSAAAGQWFVDRHDELEGPPKGGRSTRPPARRVRRRTKGGAP